MSEVTQTRQANHRGDSSRVRTLIESPLQIATVKLDGSNYLPRYVLLSLRFVATVYMSI